jgi:hypothetical protein
MDMCLWTGRCTYTHSFFFVCLALIPLRLGLCCLSFSFFPLIVPDSHVVYVLVRDTVSAFNPPPLHLRSPPVLLLLLTAPAFLVYCLCSRTYVEIWARQ